MVQKGVRKMSTRRWEAFIFGMGKAFDIGNVLSPTFYTDELINQNIDVYMANSRMTDAEKIHQDWVKVGEALAWAMSSIEEQQNVQ